MHRSWWVPVVLLSGLIACAPVHAQKKEKKEKPKRSFEQTQYKKENRDHISDLTEGKFEPVIRYFQTYLKDQPNDLESLYGLTLAYSLAGNPNKADQALQDALTQGLGMERFIAGPRTLTEKLQQRDAFKTAARDIRLLHGPMLGDLTADGCTVWLRTAHASTIRIEVSAVDTSHSFNGETKAEDDYTGTVRVSGLEPGLDYT
jgi:hypothetical protein